jgi:hypothetical protein
LTSSMPIPAGVSITRYDYIQCVRSADGLEMRAQRVVRDIETSVRWTLEVVDRLGQWLYIEHIENGQRATYSTDEISTIAKNAGFGEWQQSQVAEFSGFALINGAYEEVRLQQFQIPDPTPYPEWVSIEQLHNKGLSDGTIMKLMLEDASFRRVQGEVVEYNLNKVHNHPKVRAFMSRQNIGQATGISYEKILNS